MGVIVALLSGLALGMFLTARSGSAQELGTDTIPTCTEISPAICTETAEPTVPTCRFLPPPICAQYGNPNDPAVRVAVVEPTHSGAAPTYSGGTLLEQSLLASAVDRLGRPAEIRAVALTAPPEGYAASPAFGATGSRWLQIDVAAVENGPASTRALWLAALVAGAYRELATTAGGGGLLGYSTTLAYPDGTTHPSGGLVAAPVRGGTPLTAGEREAGAAKLAGALARAVALGSAGGASVSSADVSLYETTNRAFGALVDVKIRATDVKKAIRRLYGALRGAIAETDSWYLVVRDESGAAQYAVGSSMPTNEGVVSGLPGILPQRMGR